MKSLGQMAEAERDAAALERNPDVVQELIFWLEDSADEELDKPAIALHNLLVEWHEDGRSMSPLEFAQKLARSLEALKGATP